MDLYLVRHAEAEPKERDPTRPLSAEGRSQADRIAQALGRLSLRVSTIYHSGKLRAEQTAEILAARLNPAGGTKQLAGLAPNDDPTAVARAVAANADPVMVVGHLPHLNRLTSLLVLGDAARDMLVFEAAGVVCLRSDDGGSWRVLWYLIPRLVG